MIKLKNILGRIGYKLIMELDEATHKVLIEFNHPHIFTIDIKGNFHRGLMIGFLLGIWTTVILMAVMK